MGYSQPYILFVLFFLLVAVFQLGMPLENKSRKYINFMLIVAYVLFFGYRGFVATDWINYYTFFEALPLNYLDALETSFNEPGFILYSVLLKNISDKYEVFQLINTLTNLTLLHLFLRKYLSPKYYALGFATFIVFNGFILEINLLRNFKAVLIFLLALPYIEKRKPIKYFAAVLVAFLFHWSALFYIPLYFFLYKKIDIKLYSAVFIVGSVLYFTQIEYIQPIIRSIAGFLPEESFTKVEFYLENKIYAGSNGLTFGYLERMVMLFFILFYYKKITQKKENILFINSFLIFISLYLYFYEIRIIQDRVGINFSYSYWIIIPIIIQNTENIFKQLLFLFILLLLVAKMHLATNYIFYEYDSFLSKKYKSYDQRLEIYNKNKHIIENQ